MLRPVIFCVLTCLMLPVSALPGPSKAILLVPDDITAGKIEILTERLAAVAGVSGIEVNPASLPQGDECLLVAGYGTKSLLAGIADKNRLALGEFDLNRDGYLFRKNLPGPGSYLAAAHSFLGLYYALDELARQSAESCKIEITDSIERPALRLRGITMYDNWNAEYMDSCLAWALENRLNRIELKDTDLDDFIFYRKFNKLNRFRKKGDFKEPTWGHAALVDEKKIQAQCDWLKAYVRKCHDYDIEVVMWHHEFVVLDELCRAYPEMCTGEGVPDYSSGLFFEFLESKYDEFFQGPGAEIDGLVLTTVEGNVHLVDFGEELIFRVLDMANRMCSKYGKKLIFRTFGWDEEQEGKLADVANRLDPGVWVMHKHIPMDWMEAFPHNPNLVRVTGHTAMLETEMGHEQRGNGRFPVWVGDYFKYRLRNAMPTGIVGVTGRINRRAVEEKGRVTSARIQDPLYGGSFNPNIANLFVFAQLAWNPEADVEELYLDWAERFYGKRAAPHVLAAFRPMRRAFVQMMYARGQFLNLRYVMDYDKWREVMHWGNNLSDFDKSHPVQLRLKLLEKPDDRFFDEFLPEKNEAVGLVTRALGEVRLIRPLIPEREFKALESYFERMLNLAQFCRYQLEAFGWLGHVDGMSVQAGERLEFCRDKMLSCAEALRRWDPDYKNANTILNIEMYPNMISCIEEIDRALGE
ncbi:MAG: hypothetical protein U9N45_01060 [Gemmatimonadota bacterium]|nr:hypothetical protein [Gemmatimonadota bacterium]